MEAPNLSKMNMTFQLTNIYCFLYLWYNISEEFCKKEYLYVGSHKGTLEDGYISSSNYFNNEYKKRPKEFKRIILCIGENKYIRELERIYQIKVDAAKNCKYYNKHIFGEHFYKSEPRSIEYRKNIKGNTKPRTKEIREKLKKLALKQWESTEKRLDRSINNPSKRPEVRKKISIARLKQLPPTLGKHWKCKPRKVCF